MCTVQGLGNCPRSRSSRLPSDRHFPRSENLKFYVTYVPCNLLAWSKLLAWKMGIVFPALPVPIPICPDRSQNFLDEALP